MGSDVFLTVFSSFIEQFLLYGVTRCFRLVRYFLSPNLGTTYFSKECRFFCKGNNIQKTWSVLQVHSLVLEHYCCFPQALSVDIATLMCIWCLIFFNLYVGNHESTPVLPVLIPTVQSFLHIFKLLFLTERKWCSITFNAFSLVSLPESNHSISSVWMLSSPCLSSDSSFQVVPCPMWTFLTLLRLIQPTQACSSSRFKPCLAVVFS